MPLGLRGGQPPLWPLDLAQDVERAIPDAEVREAVPQVRRAIARDPRDVSERPDDGPVILVDPLRHG